MLSTVFLAIHVATQKTDDDLAKYIYPLSKPLPAPEITLDYSKAPDLENWAKKAKAVAIEWYPHITELLSTQDFKAPETVNFVFRENQDAPAYATRNEISFSIDWVRRRPDDFGMVVHELTHIVQAYPRNRHNTGWLTEGIADYIRWWRYEPEAPRRRINWETAKHTDAYTTTAHFLAWTSQKYNRALVPALDLNLRKAEDPAPTFKALTGKTAEELWEEFKASQQ